MRKPALVTAAIVLALTGCSEPPKAEKKAPKNLEPLTGRQAFQQMYPQARGWAPDAQPLEIKSLQMEGVKAPPGKAGAWQVIFVSPGRSRAKTYTWSAVEAEGNLHQGVFAGVLRVPVDPQGVFLLVRQQNGASGQAGFDTTSKSVRTPPRTTEIVTAMAKYFDCLRRIRLESGGQ